MGLSSDIQSRYRHVTATGAVRFTLVYKKPEGRTIFPRIDIRRLSGELLRVTRPTLLAEIRRSAASVNAAHKKSAASLKKRMESEAAKNSASIGLSFARYTGKLEDYSKKLLEGMAQEQELFVAKVNKRLMHEAERDEREFSHGDRGVSLSEVMSLLEKRLSETGDEILGGTRRIARAEAEAVLRRFREEEEYERLRGGLR